MKRWMRIRILLQMFGLLFAVGAVSQAATLTVDGSGGGNYTTIQEAINNSSAGDVIEIRSGTYDQANLQGKNLSLQAADGADVVIQSNNEPIFVPDANGVSICGTADHPIILRRNATDKLVEGGNQFGNLTFAYVQFDGNVGTVAATVGGSNPNSTITFDHCHFTCQAEVCGIVTWDSANIVLNDCVFEMMGNANAVRSTTCLPGKINANRCRFLGDKSTDEGRQAVETAALQFGDPWGIKRWLEMQQEIVATDCYFDGFSWAYEQWDADLPDNQYGDRKTVRLINPSCGTATESAQVGYAKLSCGENVYIEGKAPNDKCDWRNSTTLIHGVDVFDGGQVTIRDCILKGSALDIFPHATVNVNGYSDHPSTVTLERCFISAQDHNGIGNINCPETGNGTALAKINLVNCIMEYGDDLIDLTGPSSTELTMTHCTLFNNAGLTGATAIKVGDNTDKIITNYSILSSDDASNYFVTDGNNYLGTLNIIHYPDNSIFANAPKDTIFGDPGLQLNGHISAGSLAGGRATGSALTTDYDGEARPQGGGVPDIGADENQSVPVELSTFRID